MSFDLTEAIVADLDGVDFGALGKPIEGPKAITGDWTRFWHLTYNIAVMQWKQRFFGSVLGYAWQLVRPLMLFTVLYVFFTKIAHVGADTGPSGAYYGTQLLGSIVLFTFFQEATMNSLQGVVGNEALVRKIQFPRLVIPLSTVLLAGFNLCLNMIVVFIFGFIQGVRPMVTWVELPLIFALLLMLGAGCAMLLSALYVYFRDIQPIWEVINQILFYAAPLVIPLATVQAKLSPTLVRIYMFNPLATALQQFRHAIVTPAADSASYAMGGGSYWLAVPIGISAGICVIGFVVFNRTAPHVAEDL